MIPFYSFENIHRPVMADMITASERVIRSGNYVFGTQDFEKEFATWMSQDHCIAVNNGTSALHLALMALDIGPGDEVITVAHTFRATASVIKYSGATPVFVDIDPDTMVMDVNLVQNAITDRTRAIIPVHLYGNSVDMSSLMQVVRSINAGREHKIKVIEDCSQAHGTVYHGQHVGTLGDIGTFSFYPGKGLGALGDAGCVVSRDPELAQRISLLRSWSDSGPGYNYRMSNLQAEFLRIKLRDFDRVLAEKRQVAKTYQQAFGPVSITNHTEHSWHVYPLLVKDRVAFIDQLQDRVELKSHYARAVHQYPAFATDVDLPVTEWVAEHQASVPIYPGVDYAGVIEAIAPLRDHFTKFPG